MKLDGKVALVTGGAKGIGAAIAERFLEEGAKVVISDKDRKSLSKTAKKLNTAALRTFEGDVSDLEDVKKMVGETVKFGGRIDILVNNAGIDPPGNIVDLDVARWKLIMDVNLTGPFLCMKAAIPYMMKQRSGSIISVASLAGVRCLPDMPAYCASKGGLIQLALQAALQYGPQNIRSNVVAPGATLTNMLKNAIGTQGLRKMRGTIPLRRIAKPEEIAGVCSFLASDDASCVNGAVLLADGGVSAIDHSGAVLNTWTQSGSK